jgi:RimJ/RimL family protein N-acetyltransferase
MSLSPLTPADIPEVMRLERLPGYDAFIGRFEADEHAAQFASANARYFGLREGDGLAGFVILQEFNAPTILLRRIAVAEPGGGRGAALLRAIMDWVFENTPARALKLDVALGNPRAKHVYAREGFEQYDVDDVHYFMRIARERWAAARRR